MPGSATRNINILRGGRIQNIELFKGYTARKARCIPTATSTCALSSAGGTNLMCPYNTTNEYYMWLSASNALDVTNGAP